MMEYLRRLTIWGDRSLGETGLVGTIAFVSMVAVLLANYRRVRAAARSVPDPGLRLLSECAASGRDTVLILLLSGFTGHNIYFYHWVWLASFGQCAVQSAEAIRREGSGWSVHGKFAQA